MITIEGKYGKATVYVTDFSALDGESYRQILELLSVPCMAGQNIAIMADTHAGTGCVIGYTQTVTDSIVPNLVGVDISCGMHVVKVSSDYHFDYKALDKAIRQRIPCGTGIRKKEHRFADEVPLDRLVANVNRDRARLSIASLGSGNHFVECDVDPEGNHYLVIHSGSRHLGVEVCKFHQMRAVQQRRELAAVPREEYVAKLRAEGHRDDIEKLLKKYDADNPKVPDHLAWLNGQYMEDYLNDMKVCQSFADANRRAMMDEIIDAMGIKRRHIMDTFTTVHNYVDVDNRIIRKGAISLKNGEIAIIPMNMRDGSLIVRGKGCAEANFSGPHGAGRLMSRSAAKETLSMDEFKKSMEGIYTTSVCTGTIDEAPMAYKPMQSIIDNIGDLCDIVTVIKPEYNFKAS